MCGIHGLIRFDGHPVASALLSAMGDVTAHRGPDDEGQYIDPTGQCGIAMRRLSIIDPEGGHQPLHSADGQIQVVCNGEIYNFRELREQLIAQGARFSTGSDCEVIVHLYERYQDSCVDFLRGMFNLALWDASRKRLLLARDRLGIKPLYLLHTSQWLAFATESKALLTLPGFSAQLERRVLPDYLHLGYVPAPHSLIAGISQLPAANVMVVESGRVTRRAFWSLSVAPERNVTESDWIAQTRQTVDAAVHRQMVSDVPIGAFLSGGVDSSAVVAAMARHSDRPVKTYAIGFSGGSAESFYNELPFARQVADHLGTQHREIQVTPDTVNLLPRLLWHLDEPIADSAFLTTYLVSEFARQEVKVILSGVGGDELFGGYRRYLSEHLQDRLRRLPGWMIRWMRSAARHLPTDRHGAWSNRIRLARSVLDSTGLPASQRYRLYVQALHRETVASLLIEPAPLPVGSHDALDSAFDRFAGVDPVNQLCAVDLYTQLPDDLLLLTDKMSMAVSLECRVPLLDESLVDLAARIPGDAKIRNARLKHLLKESLRGQLPDDLIDRPKRGFGMPVGAWFKGPLSGMVKGLLGAPALRRRGLFHEAPVQALIDDHMSSRADATDALQALVNLEIWCRVTLDREDPLKVSDDLRTMVRSS
ncbi:MAG: asparagine synthase (glutamine-hydrolyzing) [Burkholderiales bacterium]|jgi:asparagine synthase (glutamine-hydrolysing)